MIVELLNQFQPDSECLLREISKHIDDNMLEWISSADYGSGADEHLVALRQIRDTATFPQKMSWYPAEVLELIRNSEPDAPIHSPGRTGVFGHWLCAFSCAALLRATREPWNYGDGVNTDYTLIKLILSLGALPVDFTSQAAKFLAWLLLHSEPEGRDEQVCAYGIGLLWFGLKPTQLVADDTLIILAQWTVRRATELYPDLLFDGSAMPLRMGLGNPPPSLWGLLGVLLCDLDLSERAAELREIVTLIGIKLAE